MKELLCLKIHSIADVITNSSSELFVCKTLKTQEEIEKWLTQAANLVDASHGATVRVYEGLDGMKQAFVDMPDYVDEFGQEGFADFFLPKGLSRQLHFPALFDLYSNWNAKDDADRRQEKIDNIARQNEKLMEKFWEDSAPLLDGKVSTIAMVQSIYDNSIPYELFDIICRQLNASRYHI